MMLELDSQEEAFPYDK
uniref:Zinc finger family protein n=1 Tax=Rhizophora mucronata TaxID=61149 RepID=A0A2P2JPV1_RHIMU